MPFKRCIQVFHRFVKDTPEHVGFYRFMYFIGLINSFYFGEVKLQRTIDITIYGTG